MLYIYDESIERRFYDFCTLDESPVINIEPVEASVYLGINLYTSSEGFQPMVEKAYLQYTAYLDQFIQHNSVGDKTYLVSTLNRLIAKYQLLNEEFKDSSIRQNWYPQSQNYTLPNASNDWQINKKQKYTREAYNFFYKMSATQRLFIDRMIAYLKLQNSAFSNILKTIEQNKKLQNPRFKLDYKISKSDEMLTYIYHRLFTYDFIICTNREFLKLFNESNEEAISVIWKKDYSHLTYFIYRLRLNILQKKNRPSDYSIARELFYSKKTGVFFSTSKKRHDKDPQGIEKDQIDEIIEYAEKLFAPKPDSN